MNAYKFYRDLTKQAIIRHKHSIFRIDNLRNTKSSVTRMAAEPVVTCVSVKTMTITDFIVRIINFISVPCMSMMSAGFVRYSL